MSTKLVALPEQLRKSFEPGTKEREKTKKIAGYGKIAGAIVAGVGTFIWFVFMFIPSFGEGGKNASRVSESTQPATVAIPMAPTLGNGRFRQILAITETEWSVPTRVVTGTCFETWAEKYGSPREKVQVSTLARPTEWIDIDGAAGVPIAWVRVGSRGPGPTEVILELRPDGQCS